MGSLKALATQKTGKIEERAKLEKYQKIYGQLTTHLKHKKKQGKMRSMVNQENTNCFDDAFNYQRFAAQKNREK